MKNTVLRYGLLSGAIILTLWFLTRPLWMKADGQFDLSKGEILGYLNMLIALSMIFFGVRQYRDTVLNGTISFGKAFGVGLLIALIAGCIYVLGWMIYYSTSDIAVTFPAAYLAYMNEKWVAAGKTAEEIALLTARYQSNFEMYKNPFVRAGMTFMEILPVGLLISLISAFMLKKK